MKVSYGCMPNIGAAINAHNRSVLEEHQPLERGGCNCREGATCPLAGECLTGNVLYDATLTSNVRNYGEKLYIGISEPEFKKRFGNHTKSFRDNTYSKDTELSKEIWKLKEKNATFEVHWRIRRLCRSYEPSSRKCLLCLNEKMDILDYDGDNLLNKRSEIISTCRHRLKHSLGDLS